MIAELAGAYAAEEHTREHRERELRDIASGDLRRATSDATEVAGQVKAYVEWLNDPLPEVASARGQSDKFARLIEIARRYPECNAFFLNEADLDSSTLWRWAHGKSKPIQYVARSLVDDIRPILVGALWELCVKHGLRPPKSAHEPDPVLKAAGSALRSARVKAANSLARVAKRNPAKPAAPGYRKPSPA